jgi:hypothetical protein
MGPITAAARSSSMASPEDYRAKADQAERLATQMALKADGERMLELAREWRETAERLDGGGPVKSGGGAP